MTGALVRGRRIAAAGALVAHRDLAVMCLDQATGDRKPKAGSATAGGPRRITAIGHVEDVVNFGFGDAAAAVEH